MTSTPSGTLTAHSVSIADVRKSFGARTVLDGVSLEVDAGLADRDPRRLRQRQDDAAAPDRRLRPRRRRDDRPRRAGGRRAAGFVPPERRRIGYVPQEGALFPHLTVGEERRLRAARPRRSADAPRRRAARRWSGSRASRSGCRTTSRAASASGSRSRGRSPRDPALVLLDEPFSSLDVELRTSMRREVVDVLRQGGRDRDPRHPRPGRGALDRRPRRRAPARHDRAVRRAGDALHAAGERRGGALRRPREPPARPARERRRAVGARRDRGRARRARRRSRARSACSCGPSRSTSTAAPRPTGVPRGVVVSREFHGHDVLVAVRLDEPAWGPDPGGPAGVRGARRGCPARLAPEPGEPGRAARARHGRRLAHAPRLRQGSTAPPRTRGPRARAAPRSSGPRRSGRRRASGCRSR